MFLLPQIAKFSLWLLKVPQSIVKIPNIYTHIFQLRFNSISNVDNGVYPSVTAVIMKVRVLVQLLDYNLNNRNSSHHVIKFARVDVTSVYITHKKMMENI